MKIEVVERKVKQVWNEVVSEPVENPADVTAYLDTLDIRISRSRDVRRPPPRRPQPGRRP